MKEDPTYAAHQKIKSDRQAARQKQLDTATEELRRAISVTSKSEAGLRVLQHILDLCHPFESPASLSSSGDTCPNKVFFNLGRQSVWTELRKLMDREVRINVEYPDVKATKANTTKGEKD